MIIATNAPGSEAAGALDAIIIGSGFGGAFSADKLVDAGFRVAMVERGPWRDTEPVRAAGIAERSPLPHGRKAFSRLFRRISGPWLPRSGLSLHKHGLFDLHFDREMTILCSSGVGGGSHVYLAANTRPVASDYWDGRAEGISAASMEPYYDAAISRMGARQPEANYAIPNFVGDRFRDDPAFTADPGLAQPAMSVEFGADSPSGNGFLGSPDGSKVTLDVLLLAPAMKRGLRVLALHEALKIDCADDGNWTVTTRDHRSGKTCQLTAPRLLLAAGTMNTLRLLFDYRSRCVPNALPALGDGFTGNADAFSWWARNDDEVDYTRGPPCHGRFALRGNEDGPELLSAGLSGIHEIPMPRSLLGYLRRNLVVGTMAPDEVGGRASWREGRLKLHYSLKDNPIMERIQQLFDKIEQLSGKKLYRFRTFPASVHPIGGARVHDDPLQGVVNGHGEVHGQAGLFVLDASALPSAPGAPPSMSVAAWASHVAVGICKGGTAGSAN